MYDKEKARNQGLYPEMAIAITKESKVCSNQGTVDLLVLGPHPAPILDHAVGRQVGRDLDLLGHQDLLVVDHLENEYANGQTIC